MTAELLPQIEFVQRSKLSWGPETADGTRIAREVQVERMDGDVSGVAVEEPLNRSQSGQDTGGLSKDSSHSFLGKIQLPDSVAVLARTIANDVGPAIRMQMELLRTTNHLTLINQGHGEVVTPSPALKTQDTSDGSSDMNQLIDEYKDSLCTKRDDIQKRLSQICPTRLPAQASGSSKLTRKIPIPFREYPNHNFVGLLIGTGGRTQQELEKRTGAKVAVRGKGQNRTHGPGHRGDSDEDLHVALSAETQAALDHAAELIIPLLDPKHASHASASSNFLAHVMSGQRANPPVAAPPATPSSTEAPALASSASAGAMGAHANQHHQYGHHYGQYANNTYSNSAYPADTNLPGPPVHMSAAGPPGFHAPNSTPVVDPACKLFVGHLPHSVTDATLHALFSHYGIVRQAEVMRHRDTGISRGYAFVHMSTRDQASMAIAALNGYRLDGRTLQVSVKGVRKPQAPPAPATWAAQPVQHYPVVSPDDLPPGVDPSELSASELAPIYPWDTSAASGVPSTPTPRTPSLNLPPDNTARLRVFFTKPFSMNGVAIVVDEPLDVNDTPPGEMSRPGAWPSNAVPASDAAATDGAGTCVGETREGTLVHAVPVAMSVEEKKRVARREATQEARAAAEAERRQRLLAAAAAAVKNSAPVNDKGSKASGGKSTNGASRQSQVSKPAGVDEPVKKKVAESTTKVQKRKENSTENGTKRDAKSLAADTTGRTPSIDGTSIALDGKKSSKKLRSSDRESAGVVNGVKSHSDSARRGKLEEQKHRGRSRSEKSELAERDPVPRAVSPAAESGEASESGEIVDSEEGEEEDLERVSSGAPVPGDSKSRGKEWDSTWEQGWSRDRSARREGSRGEILRNGEEYDLREELPRGKGRSGGRERSGASTTYNRRGAGDEYGSVDRERWSGPDAPSSSYGRDRERDEYTAIERTRWNGPSSDGPPPLRREWSGERGESGEWGWERGSKWNGATYDGRRAGSNFSRR